MKSYIVLFVVLAGFVFAEQRCPEVFDGLTNGHFDLSTQFSTSVLSANWNGLQSSEVLSYECAVISENILREKQLSDNCRTSQGFLGIPDVKNWVSVPKKGTSITINNLQLVPGVKYYIVLRTTLPSGVQLFSNTNGIVVLPQELKLEGTHAKRDAIPDQQNTHERTDRHSLSSRKPEPKAAGSCLNSLDCPIDEENRCRAAKVSVQDFLNQFYGPPRWVNFPPLEFFLYGFVIADDDNDDDDDDDEAAENHGIIAGVIAGALLLFLLLLCLLCLLALLVGVKGNEEPKFGETVVAVKTDHVDADLGSTTQHSIGNNTRVEFPDLDPHNRLSHA